jgi:hypothetical protein
MTHGLVSVWRKGIRVSDFGPRAGPWAWPVRRRRGCKQFIFIFNFFSYHPNHAIARQGGILFKSIPLTLREVKATEATLTRIYDAAKIGLRGDNLALAAGMRPEEYRRLTQLDEIAALAELKGRADGEFEISTELHKAALSGDAKAALAILQNVHGWVAKQAITVDVNQSISITAALAEAQKRVLDVIDVEAKTDQLENDSEDTFMDRRLGVTHGSDQHVV